MYYIMENIKTFEEYLKEGFDADVKTTEKGNIFRIQLPDEDSTRTFRLDKDDQPEEVLDNDKISPIDKSNPLNKFVKGAINGIRNIKEQDRANEIERVSGNYPELIDDVRRAYDNGIIRINKPDSDKVYSLWDKIKKIEVGMVDKENNYILFKDVTKSQGEWFTKTTHQVGKGEFYLPILFPDVYKNTKEEIGDNKLKIDDDNKLKIDDKDKYIDLEIKTSGAHFKFDENGKLSKEEIEFVKKNKYDDSTKAQFKTLISKTLINYLLNRKTKYNEIDLILFDNQTKHNPDGIFVLRLNKSGKNNVTDLVTNLKEIIEIDDSFSKSDDFDIRYDNTKKSIVVRLSSSKYNSNHISKETLTDKQMDSMIQNFLNNDKNDKNNQLLPPDKKKHISDIKGKWQEYFKLNFIKAAIDKGWSRAEIANVNGIKAFEKYMTNKENFEWVFKYIKKHKDSDTIIKFIWGKNSDYIKSKGITPENIDDDMLEAFIKGEGNGIDKLIKLMIDNDVDFSELIFGEEAKNIKNTLLTAENNNIEANNLIVKRNLPRCKRTNKEKLKEEDVINIINGYCSDNLDTQVEDIQVEDTQSEDIQVDGKQGKRLFISWLTRNNQDIKHNGLLSHSNLEKKLNKSEETLKKEENNDKEFLHKKESYHIQTFNEMFND